MKKLYTFLTLLISLSVFSQVSTVPSTPTANNQITITFNAIGTGLEDHTGDIYAHTGLITSASNDNSDWKNVITEWTENTEKNKLTKTGDNSYTLSITPTVFEFYNVPTTTTINSIAILFRSADGNTKSGPDLFIPLYDEGLNVVFTQPSPNSVYNLNESVNISTEASLASNLELFIDGTSVLTISENTILTTSHNFNTAGNHSLKITATANGEIKEATTNVFIKSPTQNITKPEGITYGTTINSDSSVSFLLKAPEKNEVF